MTTILEDLSHLPPKRLEKRLEQLAREALPCHDVTVFDGNPQDGLTVALHVDARGRGDVLDLARVVEDDSVVRAWSGWSVLTPERRRPYWRLLLRVRFDRPVNCLFTIGFETQVHAAETVRRSLPLLLAADRFVLELGECHVERPRAWVEAPLARDCLLQVIAAG